MVRVSIHGPGSEPAYGILSSISAGGAKFVSSVRFPENSRVLLRVGFGAEEPFSTPADVVWTRDESATGYAHGVQFRIEDPELKERLRAILARPELVASESAGAPGENGGSGNVDRELAELVGEMEKGP